MHDQRGRRRNGKDIRVAEMRLGCLFYIHTFDFYRLFRYNGCRSSKETQQMKQKHYAAFTSQERRMVIESLNRLRNKLIAADRYTDAVDELLIKVAMAGKR